MGLHFLEEFLTFVGGQGGFLIPFQLIMSEIIIVIIFFFDLLIKLQNTHVLVSIEIFQLLSNYRWCSLCQ